MADAQKDVMTELIGRCVVTLRTDATLSEKDKTSLVNLIGLLSATLHQDRISERLAEMESALAFLRSETSILRRRTDQFQTPRGF